jgi:hypothetical protein
VRCGRGWSQVCGVLRVACGAWCVSVCVWWCGEWCGVVCGCVGVGCCAANATCSCEPCRQPQPPTLARACSCARDGAAAHTGLHRQVMYGGLRIGLYEPVRTRDECCDCLSGGLRAHAHTRAAPRQAHAPCVRVGACLQRAPQALTHQPSLHCGCA